MTRLRPAMVVLAAGLLDGCMMGPNYQRPASTAPPAYRGAPVPEAGASPTASFGDEKWFDLFQDPTLQTLMRTALKQNFDVRIAATRITQAQEMAGITRAAEFPEATVNASLTDAENPKIAAIFPQYAAKYGGISLGVVWNLDFWGRYRRATEAARAQLLSSQWAQKAVVSSLVAQVASGYFQLLALDAELDTARRTLSARHDQLRLTQVLAANGSASQLNLAESEELVEQAAATIPGLESQQEQEENLLAELLGENPQAIPRGLPLDRQPNPPSVPPGLPSQLLERRPDIREAEANLMAANAEVGEARAAMFPNITLTADRGLESYALSKLFAGQSQQWSISPSLSQVVFAAGSLRAAVRYSEAQKQQMLLTYGQTIATAFQQVSDALVGLAKAHEVRTRQQALAAAAERAEQLSDVLFHNGSASQLQVLTAATNAFADDLELQQAELMERLALVQLYSALGGGWQ